MANKDDVEKGKELSPEESAFRNAAARVIKNLTRENQRLSDMVRYGGSHGRSKGNRYISSVSHIQGLEGLRPRLGQQFQRRREE